MAMMLQRGDPRLIQKFYARHNGREIELMDANEVIAQYATVFRGTPDSVLVYGGLTGPPAYNAQGGLLHYANAAKSACLIDAITFDQPDKGVYQKVRPLAGFPWGIAMRGYVANGIPVFIGCDIERYGRGKGNYNHNLITSITRENTLMYIIPL